MWGSLVAVLRKEFLHIARDRTTLVLTVSIPLFQLVLFGFLDQTVRDMPTVVVDQDRTPASRLLADRLSATGTFALRVETFAPERAREEIIAGRARAAVIIPPDYADRLLHGRPAQVLVLVDGSDATASSQAQAAFAGLVATMNAEALAARAARAATPGAAPATLVEPISLRPLILFNPGGRTANYIIPGMIAILLQIVAFVLVALSIVREREHGTLEQLLVTPIHPLGLVLGKLAPYLVIGTGEMVAILVIMRYGFHVPIRGSVPLLFLMATLYQLALLAMGLYISTRAHTQAEAQQMAQLFFLPSVFLSGYIFPVEGLPLVLRAAGQLLPATHMIAVLRGVILRGAGVHQLVVHVVALALMSAALLWLSARRFRKVME